MKVNAISEIKYRASRVNFNGEYGKKNSAYSHSTNTLKAIPLAVLLAMSPLNTIETKAQDKVVFQVHCASATPTNRVCNIDFISTDNVDSTFERVLLKFPYMEPRTVKDETGKYVDAEVPFEQAITPEKLKTIKYIANNGGYDMESTSYYVVGDGYQFYGETRAKGTDKILPGSSPWIKYSTISVQINKELYDYLSNIYGEDGIKYEYYVKDIGK